MDKFEAYRRHIEMIEIENFCKKFPIIGPLLVIGWSLTLFMLKLCASIAILSMIAAGVLWTLSFMGFQFFK